MTAAPAYRVVVSPDSPGLTDVPGFRCGAAACDVRGKGDFARLDVALIYSALPCTAVGTFTRNDVKAAPVRLCQEALAAHQQVGFHGIVANSGNANACTGPLGRHDAEVVRSAAAVALGVHGADRLLVASTGRIGRRLPVEKLQRGVVAAAEALSSTPAAGHAAAQAILTSDTRPKTVTARLTLPDGRHLTVAGIAKGAGMIQPGMATMLAFVATDAAIDPAVAQELLRGAVEVSFNAVTVDGDMSTNDTVLLLANGASEVEIGPAGPLAEAFREAVTAVCSVLAEKIVGDGEKISKVVEVIVTGAKSAADAEKVARAIGNSLLVKSSWCGQDPNWGRLADAAGYAQVGLIEEKLDIFYDDVPALLGGNPQDEHLPKWKTIVAQPRFRVTVALHLGEGRFRLLASDLTEGYVTYNKSE